MDPKEDDSEDRAERAAGPEAGSQTGSETGSEKVGSLGEEAVLFIEALAGLVGQASTDGGGRGAAGAASAAISDLAGQASRTFKEVNDHLATDAEECRYCPICRTVHVVRALSPEVKSHLLTAGASLVQAAAALMATVPPKDGMATPSSDSGSSGSSGSSREGAERTSSRSSQRIRVDGPEAGWGSDGASDPDSGESEVVPVATQESESGSGSDTGR